MRKSLSASENELGDGVVFVPWLVDLSTPQLWAGVYKVPYNLIGYSSPILFYLILIFFPVYSVHFPFYPLDILPDSLNITGNMIFFPLYLFHLKIFPTVLIIHSPLHNLIFFPNRLDKIPPHRVGE